MSKPTKDAIIALLTDFINQRPGLDPADYGLAPYSRPHERADALRAYNSDVRRITKQLHDARRLIDYVAARDGITADDLLDSFRAFSGRLSLIETANGHELDYYTGQYYPTEYRAAVCAVLASAIWDYHRPDYQNDSRAGDSLRDAFVRIFGKPLASRWFS